MTSRTSPSSLAARDGYFASDHPGLSPSHSSRRARTLELSDTIRASTGALHASVVAMVSTSFLIALVYELALTTTLISASARPVLATGFMGGLTTYSSFNYETTGLLRERAWATGFLNLGVTLAGCFVAGLLGLAVARRLAGS